MTYHIYPETISRKCFWIADIVKNNHRKSGKQMESKYDCQEQ